MKQEKFLQLKSLREQVYEHIREALDRGALVPGAYINLNRLSEKLGVSKTPLRFALLQLQNEGFVTILPHRGCRVNVLSLEEIGNLYQIIGALEASVIVAEFEKLTPKAISTMRLLNETARAGLDEDNFNRYYDANVRLHDCYLKLSCNAQLRDIVAISKHRLYDFPRKTTYLKGWELRSTGEHEEVISLMEAGDARGAADYIRDVHWSYEVQERFIKQYYAEALGAIKAAECVSI